jgi:hypothetical protein
MGKKSGIGKEVQSAVIFNRLAAISSSSSSSSSSFLESHDHNM